MKIYLFVIALLQNCFVIQSTFAQSTYTRAFENFTIADRIIQSTNYSVILACTESLVTATDTADVYLIKLNAQLDTVWARRYDFDVVDEISALQQTKDKGFIAAITASTKLVIFKTDSSGNIQWSRTYATGFNPKILEVDNGYLLASGILEVVAGNGQEIRLAKLDTTGVIVWDQAFVRVNDQTLIDMARVQNGRFNLFVKDLGVGHRLIIDSNGTYLGANRIDNYNPSYNVVGQYNDSTFFVGGNNGTIQKLMNGIPYISRKLFMLDNNADSITIIPHAINKTADGNVLVASEIFSPLGWIERDMLVLKMDTNMNIIWSKRIGKPGVREIPFQILENTNLDIILSFSTAYSFTQEYQYNIITLDAQGNGNCDISNCTAYFTPSVWNSYYAVYYTAGLLNSTSIPQAYTAFAPNFIFTSPCYPAAISDKIPSDSMTVSPNPVNNSFIISGTNQNGTITIFDLNGRHILSQHCTASSTLIDITDLPTGMYVLKYSHDHNHSILRVWKN